MTDKPEQNDKDPEPLKHSDAQRVGSDGQATQEIEDDPARDPEEQELRDIKGG